MTLSLLVGLLSLSQEILWVRTVSFALQGASHAFALVLVLFLIGVAYGASLGKRWCANGRDLLDRAAQALALSAALDTVPVLLLPFVAQVPILLAGLLVLVMASAAAKATTFPVAHHLGSQQAGARLGRSVSKVYFANIVGCTLGPILTGYVLLDVWTLETCLSAVAVGSGLLAWACARRSAASVRKTPVVVLVTTLGLASFAMPPHALVHALTGEAQVEQVLQNRHGIIHTVVNAPGNRTVYGGNVYDGKTTVDMASNANALDRAVVLLAMHPRPERVLVLGLSGGAWTRLLTASPEIREIVVLEINPGYVDLVRQIPETAPLLADPRVRVHIDDGRRWLRRHPDERFDLIVQNTTYHWRAYGNNLLSIEHLALVREHLRPGGITAWNSTYSADALKTADAVFPYTTRRGNFIYGADTPFDRLRPDADAVLRALQLNGRPVFAAAAFDTGGLAARLMAEPFVSPDQRYVGLNFKQPAVITDGNLLAEQAHGSAMLHEQFDAVAAWLDRIRRVTAPGPSQK
jgi:spermidine synthase